MTGGAQAAVMPACERSVNRRWLGMSDHDQPKQPPPPERPSCVRAGDSFTLIWPGKEIEAIITIVGDDRRCLEAELVFRTTTNHEHLLRRRMDLLVGTRGRNEVIKDLKVKDRHNTIDWMSVVDQMCETVIREWRRSDPAEVLQPNEPTDAEQWTIRNLVPRDQIGALYGFPGEGKSTLMLSLLTYAVLGKPFPGGFDVPGGRPLRCLLLDFEPWKVVQQKRYAQLLRGLGVAKAPDTLFYREMTRPLHEDIARVRQIVLDRMIDLVVVDSIGMAAGMDPETASASRQTFGALIGLRTSVLAIMHLTKGVRWDAGPVVPFGGVFNYAAPKAAWAIRRDENAPEEYLTMGLFPQKSNNGRLQRPVGLEFDYRFDMIRVRKCAPRNQLGFRAHLTLTERITEAKRASFHRLV